MSRSQHLSTQGRASRISVSWRRRGQFVCLLLASSSVACQKPPPDPAPLIDRLKRVDERNRKPAADALAAMGPELVPG